MKLIERSDGIEIRPEGVAEEVYLKTVLGVEKAQDRVSLVLDHTPTIGLHLKSAPEKDRIVSIEVEIKGYGEEASFSSNLTTLNDEKSFGHGKSLEESLGSLVLMYLRRNKEIKTSFPNNAQYHEHGSR